MARSQPLNLSVDKTKGSLCSIASLLIVTQNYALWHKSLISMHMVLINLCMQMECLVSQNYTTGINVGRPPKLFDRKWWMRYRSKLWENQLSVQWTCNGFYFHCQYKRAGFLLSPSNLTKWMKNDENSSDFWKKKKKMLYRKVTTKTKSGEMWWFMEKKSVWSLFKEFYS